MRDLDDQPQVGLDHLLARFLVAFLDAGGQFDFLLGREQFHLADFAKVKFDGGIAIIGRALARVGQVEINIARHFTGRASPSYSGLIRQLNQFRHSDF